MAIVVPPEFNYFCQQFHQDVGVIHGSREKMIAAALGALDQSQKTVVREFLDELLNGQYSPDEIKGIWRRSPADIVFSSGEGLVKFLRDVRTELD